MKTDTFASGVAGTRIRATRNWLAIGAMALLTACGVGDDGDGGQDTGTPATEQDASRFLAQASFGADDASLTRLSQVSLAYWIDEQFRKPQTLHRLRMDQVAADQAAMGGSLNQNHFFQSFWMQAVSGEDQLRQRAAFALSQIFVISYVDGTVGNQPRGVASYYDMLGEKAFGNYRDLLEGVALHPMMGIYLSHLRNRKEEGSRVPDENFAREVMQLFSIGLYQLNQDGSVKSGNVETYTHDDIVGLARVFTGFSWYAGSDRSTTRFNGGNPHPERDWRPMQAYNSFHSTSEKKFLGKTIGAGASDAEADLKIALDTLYNHPNVGPFFGKQLIQRLVTSNPSPGYVSRVAAAFNNNGSGVRGDMKAVWRAVLLDPEARQYNAIANRSGKLREPVLRLANLMRAFKARSQTGDFAGIDNTDDAGSKLGQTVMRSGSVFNFYRPGYVPPNSSLATAGLVAPELQITHEVSVAGYLNYLRTTWLTVSAGRDIQLDFSKEMALASNAGALVDRMSTLLMGGRMPAAVRTSIVAAVNGRTIPTSNATNIENAKRDRVFIAIFLTMGSPDYLIQK
jgi:uncharacterized protein (DUF1800 family)